MRVLTAIVLLGLIAGSAYGQNFPEPSWDQQEVKQPAVKAKTVLPELYSSPEAEVHAVALDLYRSGQGNLVDARGQHVLSEYRYLSLYAVPASLRDSVRRSMFFWVNSLSRRGKIYRPEPVPDTGNLLYRIRLSNYSWTPEAWETVSGLDPFFRLPIVAARDYEYMRYAAGNAIIRADWFVDTCSDTNESPSYYTLLYASAQVTRNGKLISLNGNPPATATEFREVWGVDLNQLKRFEGLDRGAIIPDETSIVAFHNRILWRVPTVTGYYWQTFDVKESTGLRDFTETRFPKQWDANEYIVSMNNGLQAYLLSDNKDKRVEFADPFVARDDTLAKSAHVVRTSQSCVFCHSTGILPTRDFLTETTVGGVTLYEYDPKIGQREEEFYLNGTNQKVMLDQYGYAVAVGACNGLSPKDTTREFIKTISFYRAPITVEQAARECGTTVEQLKAALSWTTKGRLAAMATQNVPIPRRTWDKDVYAEAMLLLREYQRHR